MVNRYYIFKDGTQIGVTATREDAIDMIRRRQKRETHYLLKSEFSITTVVRSSSTMKKAHEEGALESVWSKISIS